MRCARLTPLLQARIAAGRYSRTSGVELVALGEQRLGVGRRQVGHELPPAVAHAVRVHQEDELRRLQPHRDLRGDFLDGEVEDLAGGRIADRRNQHDVAVVETLLDRLGVDAAHFAGELHVDAVDHAHRLGREVVAARHAVARAGHRRIGKAERQQRLDARAHLARGLEHAVHRVDVGDAHAVRIAARNALRREDRLDLRPAAVHDDEPDAEAVQQVEIVDHAQEFVVGDHFAAERDDERPAAERVHVRRGRADQVHERAHRRRIGGGRWRRARWAWVRRGVECARL